MKPRDKRYNFAIWLCDWAGLAYSLIRVLTYGFWPRSQDWSFGLMIWFDCRGTRMFISADEAFDELNDIAKKNEKEKL